LQKHNRTKQDVAAEALDRGVAMCVDDDCRWRCIHGDATMLLKATHDWCSLRSIVGISWRADTEAHRLPGQQL